jgi:hypothetical protein
MSSRRPRGRRGPKRAIQRVSVCSPGLALPTGKELLDQYVGFLHREAAARVDAGGIPQRWKEPGGLEIAFAYLKKMESGMDKIVRGIANEAIRMGDRNSIADHMALRLEMYPEMLDFVAEALRSPRSKFSNRPPRQATTEQRMWMARYVGLERARNPQKGLTQIYDEIATIFGMEPRTVANAYRTYKEWIEFQNEKLIDWTALVLAVMRAHP